MEQEPDPIDRLEAALARIEARQPAMPAPMPAIMPAPPPPIAPRLDALIVQLRDALAPTMP